MCSSLLKGENDMNTIEKYKAVIALVVGLVVVFLGPRADLDAGQLLAAVLVIASYILGVKIEARAR
jgi:hypothetical protein